MNNFLYAQLDNTGVVVGISELKAEVKRPELIALNSLEACSLGDKYVDGVFVPNLVVITQITVGAFRKRLTRNEKVAFKTSTDPDIQVFNDDLLSLTYIDIHDPELLAGLQYFASKNLLELPDGQTNEDRIAELLRVGTQVEAV